MKTEEKSPKKKNRALVFVIFVFVALYIPSFFHWIYGDKIQTDMLTDGSIEETIEVEGLIIRDEVVINSPFTGRFVINVSSGEKAASGEAIATLLKDSSVGALDDLRKKDIEILKAKNEKVKAQEIFSDDISKVEGDIYSKLKLLLLADNVGNTDTSWFLRQDIDKLIEKKADILGGTGGTDTKIQQLVKEREQLQSLVNSYTKQIYAPVPGIVSYSIDGTESALGVDKIANLTVDQYESLKPVFKEVKGNALSAEQDKPVFKLLKGIEQYIIVELPQDKAATFQVGKTTENIRISQVGKIYEGVVYNISDPDNGKCLVAFKTEKGINETASYRRVNIDIIEKASSGLKIPRKSLVDYNEVNGTARVMFLKANYATSKEVTVVEADEESAIIASSKDPSKGIISRYDNYLVNPQNIQEGQLIEK